MRVKVRDELDLNSKINLRRLSPVMKIYAGVVTKWRSTDFYKKNLNRHREAAAVARMQQDEQLKQLILAQIYKELNANEELQKVGKMCSGVTIQIGANYKKSLDRVLQHKDFLPYNIVHVPENEDIRKAFPNMPYLIKVTKKVV